jgi:DNA-binding transcriptional regulator YhcF (GntR family)
MKVDPASVWPLSAQLAQLLRELIRSGQLGPGDRVPSEPQLSRQYSVSRDTAQRALSMLEDEGLITRRRGVGSIVAEADPVKEVRARPGARISARLPTVAEQQSTRAGMWVPMLAVEEPGWPEKLYPADRVVVVVSEEEGDEPAELPGGHTTKPAGRTTKSGGPSQPGNRAGLPCKTAQPGSRSPAPLRPLDIRTASSQIMP